MDFGVRMQQLVVVGVAFQYITNQPEEFTNQPEELTSQSEERCHPG